MTTPRVEQSREQGKIAVDVVSLTNRPMIAKQHRSTMSQQRCCTSNQ